jgi:tetratricopeptide (TPR) repeat protein
VVASHYLDAYRAVPDAPDAAEIKAKARAALIQAGKRAASLAAAAEGRRYYEQAIELADHESDAAPLHEHAGKMAFLDGKIEAARQHLQSAREVFERMADLRAAARVSAAYGEVLLLDGRLEEAVEVMEHALGVLSGEEPDEATAMLAAQLGRTLYFSGRREDSFSSIEQALIIAETLQLPNVLSQAMNSKALILQSYARFEEATLLLKRALEIALENNLGESALRAYNNLGAFMDFRDDHQSELDFAADGLEHARRLGNRLWEEGLLWGKVSPLMHLGRWDEALATADEARGTAGVERSGYIGPETLFTASIHAWRGDVARARAELTETDQSQSEDVQTRAAWHSKNAHVARAEQNLEASLASAEIAFGSRVDLGLGAPMTKDGFVEGCETAFAMKDLDKVEELLEIVRGWRPGEIATFMRAGAIPRWGCVPLATRSTIFRCRSGRGSRRSSWPNGS